MSIYLRQALQLHADSVYTTAKPEIHMQLQSCVTNWHYNKVDSTHLMATCVDNEKTVIIHILCCFFIDVKLGLFYFYPLI